MPGRNGRNGKKKGAKAPASEEMFGADDMKGTRRETPRLSVPHDNQLTVLALGAHARNLVGLAEKNRVAGYRLAAATQQGDARSIVERIVPMFAEQAEIPLATPAESRAAIANLLRPILRQSESFKDDEATRISILAQHIEELAGAVYARAFNDGIAAREMDPHVAMVRAVAAHDVSLERQVSAAGK